MSNVSKVHYEHNSHPFHRFCTTVAAEDRPAGGTVQAAPATEDQGGPRPRQVKPGREHREHPIVSEANIRSLYPGRSRSNHPTNWFGGSFFLIKPRNYQGYPLSPCKPLMAEISPQ